MNKQALAEQIARLIEPQDRAARLLGLQLVDVRPGHVRMSMRVTREMLNAQHVCHGGVIFSLADSSFGYASNSHNQRAHVGRTRLYSVRVTNQRQELIALFNGKSATVKGTWIE